MPAQFSIVESTQIEGVDVSLAIMGFADCTMIAVSDTGTFGSFYKVQVAKGGHTNQEAVVTIDPIFGINDHYFQVLIRLENKPKFLVQFNKVRDFSQTYFQQKQNY